MTQLTTGSPIITTTLTTFVAKPGVFVSDLTRDVVTVAISLVVGPIICVFGIITNLINITVFIRSGFSDSVNTVLLGLSLSDVFLLLITLWQSMSYFPPFQQAALPFDPLDTGYVTGGIPLTYFSRTTSWITAFITLERYLCVAFPLKVKTLSTRSRSTIVVVSIYLLMAATVVPLFYTSRVEMKFFPSKNITRLGLVFTADRFEVAKYANPFNNFVVQIGSFLFVLGFTVLLFNKLKNNNKWRENVTDRAALLSRRDQKVALMIVLISSNFIVCYAGITVEYIWPMFEPEFTSGLMYRNLFIVFTAFVILTQQINASINLFIYLKMSSKYRRVFNSLCLCVLAKTTVST